MSRRRGATLVAVMTILLIVCLLAYQAVKTMLILRRGQDNAWKIQQARELLELGRQLARLDRENFLESIQASIVVELGEEFGKLQLNDRGVMVATWPVDASGKEFPRSLPVVVTSDWSPGDTEGSLCQSRGESPLTAAHEASKVTSSGDEKDDQKSTK